MKENGFLQAIQIDPTDEVSWLVYADWLEDQGDLRSEAIRILSTVGFPSNLHYYPDLQKQMTELREIVDGEWLDAILELRESLNEQSPHNPTPEQVEQMWQEVEITPLPDLLNEGNTSIEHMIRDLSRIYSDGATYARFQISAPATLSWYASRNRWSEIHFFQRLIQHPRMVGSVPHAYFLERVVEDPEDEMAEEGCSYGRGAQLPDCIAHLLLQGALFGGLQGSAEQAGALASRFCQSLFGSLSTVWYCHWREEGTMGADFGVHHILLMFDKSSLHCAVLAMIDIDDD